MTRRLLILIATLACSTAAWATFPQGTRTVLDYPETYRVGNSPLANGTTITYYFGAQGYQVTKIVSAIFVRTGAEYAPGSWRVAVTTNSTDERVVSTITLAPHQWNRIDLIPPVELKGVAGSAELYVKLSPAEGSTAELDFLNGHDMPRFPDATFNAWDAYVANGPMPGISFPIAVAEIANEQDPLALAACPASDHLRTQGNPYAEPLRVLLQPGQSATQHFLFTPNPYDDNPGIEHIDIPYYPGSTPDQVAFSVSCDGWQSARTGVLEPSDGEGLPASLRPPGEPTDAGTHCQITLTALDAGFMWKGARTGGDACHAATRATYAGAVGHAVFPDGGADPGADFAIEYWQCDLWYPMYVDADQDSVGGNGPAIQGCFVPGYSSGTGDCDDSRADVAPGNPELCDGVDNDCDGVIDRPDCPAPDAGTSDADAGTTSDAGTSFDAGTSDTPCDAGSSSPDAGAESGPDGGDSRQGDAPAPSKGCGCNGSGASGFLGILLWPAWITARRRRGARA